MQSEAVRSTVSEFSVLSLQMDSLENLEMFDEVQERDVGKVEGKSNYGVPHIRTDNTSYSRVPYEASLSFTEVPQTTPFLF